MIIAESDFDLSPFCTVPATEKEEEASVSFSRKTKGAAASFAHVKLDFVIKITSTDQEVDAKQLETRAESLRMNEEESQSLALLLSKQKDLSKIDSANFRDQKITERYAAEKKDIIKEDDEMLDLFGEDAGDPNDDFS